MLRAAVTALLVVVCSAALATDVEVVDRVRALRLQGDLVAAKDLALQVIAADTEPQQIGFDLHLELAKIHDRFGLHLGTRPVAAALEEINVAARIARDLGQSAAADIELALADYHYRADMSERLFETAFMHARQAIVLFAALGDKYGEAEAVHRLGLIHLQRRELHKARQLFDESLQLDAAGGARDFFRGEYERHVGFVYALQDDPTSALPYFERSLEYRIKAGAIDASLFAAVSLASTLIELGRADEARLHLDYALEIADRIPSPVGRQRAEAVLARITPE